MTSTTASPTKTTWIIDPTHTLVEFSAKHLMITTVKGRFGAVQGSITLDRDIFARSSVAVSIDAASIDTRTEQRDQHLRSPDFLDVANYPAIEFRSTRVEGTLVQGESFRLVGQLTIHGVSRDVVIDATFEGTQRDPWGGERVSFSGTTKIDRRDFGLTYNQVLETGGLLVGNEIKIALEVQATQAS